MIVAAVGILVGIDIALLVIASAVPQLRIYAAEVQSNSEYPSTESDVRSWSLLYLFLGLAC